MESMEFFRQMHLGNKAGKTKSKHSNAWRTANQAAGQLMRSRLRWLLSDRGLGCVLDACWSRRF